MINKLMELLKKYKSVILYLIFGVLTTVINILCYSLLTKLFHVEMLTSNVISWVVAVTFAYFTNKIYVFESNVTNKKSILKEFILFYYYRVLSLLIETFILYIYVDILHFNDIIIKIIANVLVIILNYVFSKFLIFNRKNNKRSNNGKEEEK